MSDPIYTFSTDANHTSDTNQAFSSPHHVQNALFQQQFSEGANDDLAAHHYSKSPPPAHSSQDARLLYRQWRTGSANSDAAATPANALNSTDMSDIHVPDSLSRSPFEQPSRPTAGSPDQRPLPRISERQENSTLYANAHDPDAHAKLLSQEIAAREGLSAQTSLLSSSAEDMNRHLSTSSKSLSSVRRATSHNGLADLEKQGYFPAAPKPTSGFHRGLKNSVVNDMCQAVAKHIVGDMYVPSSHDFGSTKVLNHLYEPVFKSVKLHFARFPARYALSVDPADVPMHMRLLTRHQRHPEELNISSQAKKDDDGNTVQNLCEVVVISSDKDSLLDAITRALTSMKGSIVDADVMTTHDGVTLDRFVVKGDFLDAARLSQLQQAVEDNLLRLSVKEPESDKEQSTDVETLAEKLGVMDMVQGKNEDKPEWQLKLSEIKLDKAVGNGRSGNTYSARWRGTHVAAKLVDASAHGQGLGQELLNEFQREVAVVSKLRHPNIVLFLGAAVSPPKYCLVFEFMEKGTLTDLIRQRRSPLEFFRIAKEIAMGMNYLHLCSIMHRDLKSANVLLDAHGTVKISDFGLSCVLDMGAASADLTAETGTYRWMAPEVIRHEPYSSKADVYSFAVVLWEMLAKDQPFRGLTPIQAAFAVARQQMRPALPKQTPMKVGELVEHCWHQDPSKRPDFASILEALPIIQTTVKKRDFKNLGFVVE